MNKTILLRKNRYGDNDIGLNELKEILDNLLEENGDLILEIKTINEDIYC